jgi:hypothetical protein
VCKKGLLRLVARRHSDQFLHLGHRLPYQELIEKGL